MRLTQVRTAWLWLVVALALHVIDEASTGFLDVYNPTVRALRERFGWFPMPEFRFDVWVAGLAVLVLGLALLTPLVDRGDVRCGWRRLSSPVSWCSTASPTSQAPSPGAP